MAGFKIRAEFNMGSLKGFVEQKEKLVRRNIASVLRNQAIPHLIDLIMVGYDSLSDLANTGPDDPTNPNRWREEFYVKLQKDLEDTFIVTGEGIRVKLGDKGFLGYNASGIDPDDTEPLHWLVFYLEGLIGDWAFITPEVYEVLAHGRAYEPGWGRFEQGFMVSREDYEGQGWDRIIPFAQVRHPFSGFSPTDIFSEALHNFKLRHFVGKAVAAAAEGRRI